jgi:hypothetical protein
VALEQESSSGGSCEPKTGGGVGYRCSGTGMWALAQVVVSRRPHNEGS